MFTWGSKYLFAVGVAALLGAALYALIGGGDPPGVMSFGYKGAVGDHTGYAILSTTGVVGLGLGVFNVVTHDGDAEEASARVGVDHTLTVFTPRTATYWGPLTAFGVASLIIGISASQTFVVLGIVVLAVVAIQWPILAWSDRATTGDDDVNEGIRKWVLGPVEISIMAMLGVTVLVLAASQALRTLPEAWAIAIGVLTAVLTLGAATAISKIDVSRSVIVGVAAVGALSVLVVGVVGAA